MHCINRNQTVHIRKLAYNAYQTVGPPVPVTLRSRLVPSPIPLHDKAGYYILERFISLMILLKTLVHDLLTPIIYAVWLEIHILLQNVFHYIPGCVSQLVYNYFVIAVPSCHFSIILKDEWKTTRVINFGQEFVY